MKLNISNIELDEDIYPRSNKSPTTVANYVEALRGGAKFPPIEVQKITDGGKEKTVILDGYHRWKAYIEADKQLELFESEVDFSEIEANYWKDDVLDKSDAFIELNLRAAEANSKHGDRLNVADNKQVARRIISHNSEYDVGTIANSLSVSKRSVYDWVGDILAARKANRNNLIYRLHLLGWTQREIAETCKCSVGTVNAECSKIAELQKLNKHYVDEMKEPMAKAAEKLYIDETLAWAIHLQGKSDDERLEQLNKALSGINLQPRYFDIWNFSKCMPLTGKDVYPGRIPGQIVFNVLYFFTKSGDLVIDPMAGGGTVIDACLLMDRKCYAYDLEPSRDDILAHDIEQSLPAGSDKCDLMFIDPPYWSMLDDEYTENSVSNKTLEEFNVWLSELANQYFCTLQFVLDDKSSTTKWEIIM